LDNARRIVPEAPRGTVFAQKQLKKGTAQQADRDN
jgi:hypothetical protein